MSAERKHDTTSNKDHFYVIPLLVCLYTITVSYTTVPTFLEHQGQSIVCHQWSPGDGRAASGCGVRNDMASHGCNTCSYKTGKWFRFNQPFVILVLNILVLGLKKDIYIFWW